MITIIGAGKVGAAAALFTALKKLDDQILLLDIVKGLPQGEAMDLNHMLSEKGIDVEVRGSNDYSEMKDSKIIPVTNPLDPMAHVAYKVSGFKRNRIFGMGNMLDLSRFIQFIHEATKHSRSSIRALVIGEHGENMLPLTRFSSVSGIPLTSLLTKDKLDALVEDTKQVAAKVIEQKGATIHAPGNAISTIIEAVVRDQKKVIPVATALDGEYGFSDITMGVPAVIGKNGVEKIIELELNDEEKNSLQKSADSVKNAISNLNI